MTLASATRLGERRQNTDATVHPMDSAILALVFTQLLGAGPQTPQAEPDDNLTPLTPIGRTAAPSPTPVATPVTAPVVEATAAPSRATVGFEVGLKLALVFPVAKTGATTASLDGATTGSRSVAPAVALAIRYRLPFARSLIVAAEGGYSRLSGAGSRELSNDPDFGTSASWTWKMDLIPILLGLAWELPFGLPIKFAPVAGGAAIFVSSQSTYVAADGQVANAPQPGWALGWYAGVEASVAVGPGAIALEARYLGARTDLGFPRLYGKTVNGSPGDVQGTQVFAGYRFSF